GAIGVAARQCDSLDRDCDGVPDYLEPPCVCENGTERACGTDVGECVSGTESCVAAAWVGCNAIFGRTEIWDGLDKDCSGTPDDHVILRVAQPCWIDAFGAPVCADPSSSLVRPLTTVQLDGTGSTDADGTVATYAWRIASAPGGSSAALSDATS